MPVFICVWHWFYGRSSLHCAAKHFLGYRLCVRSTINRGGAATSSFAAAGLALACCRRGGVGTGIKE